MDIILALTFSGVFLGYVIEGQFESLTKAVLGTLILLLMIIWIVRVLNSKDWNTILTRLSHVGSVYEIFSLKKRHWIRMLAVVSYLLIFLIRENGFFMISGLWTISILNQWISIHKSTILPQSRYFLHTIFDIFIYVLIFKILDDIPVNTLPFIIVVSILASMFMQKARELIWEP
jgi:hypothetical protein